MSQEVSKRLGLVGYNPNIPHLQLDELQPIYPPFTVPPEKITVTYPP